MDVIEETAESWGRDHFEGRNPFVGDVVAEAVWWAELMAGVWMVDCEREAFIDRYHHDVATGRIIGDSDHFWWDRFSDDLCARLIGESTIDTRFLEWELRSRLARRN